METWSDICPFKKEKSFAALSQEMQGLVLVFKPGPHWWKVSALTIVPYFIPQGTITGIGNTRLTLFPDIRAS